MLTKELINKFYEDVDRLGLKRPVAYIAKMTTFSKGQVSDYLSKKKEPSENFINTFYEKFKEGLQNVPRSTIYDLGQNITDKQAVTKEELYERLLAEKEISRKRAEEKEDKLLAIIKDNLNLLVANSNSAQITLRAILDGQDADDLVIMDNQDEQMHHEKGSSALKSGNMQVNAAKARLKKGKQKSVHK
jgi:hypothetical protein